MQPIQLEPLNPFPRESDGFGCNPLYAEYWKTFLKHTERPTEDEWTALEQHFNIKTEINSIYSCASDTVINRLDNNDLSAVAAWEPLPPNDERDWFLVSIYDCDDGPHALWAYAVA